MKRLFLLCCISFLSISVTYSKNITGYITNEKGEPVASAIISTKHSTTGALSDFDGKFKLNNVQQGDTLSILFKSGNLIYIPIDDKKLYKIDAEGEAGRPNEETVNIGYQTIDESKRTSATDKITRSQLLQTGKSSLIDALLAMNMLNQGRNGLYIRGEGSITNTEPLFVVDGTPVSFVSYLTVNDIETVEIIKDGTASIYGNQGANGVILITTRKR